MIGNAWNRLASVSYLLAVQARLMIQRQLLLLKSPMTEILGIIFCNTYYGRKKLHIVVS